MYLDNYDELRKVDKALAATIAGTPSAWTLAVRATYETLGLPRHPKKAVTQEAKAEVQGAWVDGVLGHATPKVEKILRYVRLGNHQGKGIAARIAGHWGWLRVYGDVPKAVVGRPQCNLEADC